MAGPTKDKDTMNFSGNCAANTVPASSQRYICPVGLNATLATDPAAAEIIIQEETIVKKCQIKITNSQPVGNVGLKIQLVKNGNVVEEVNPIGAGAAAGVYTADFANLWKFSEDDTMCIGVLNTSTSVSARLGAFGLG